MRATGKDMVSLTAELGGAVSGTPTWQTPVDLKCYCRTWTRNLTGDKIDVTGRCNNERQQVPMTQDATVTLDLAVPKTGSLIPDAWHFQYIRIICVLVTGETYTDILMVDSITWTSPELDLNSQTVECGPTFVA